MTGQDIIIFALLIICAGLLVWILILDHKLEQYKGYIDRIDREERAK